MSKIILISDTNISPLKSFLTKRCDIEIFMPKFGEAAPSLMDIDRNPVNKEGNYILVWVKPDSVSYHFRKIFEYDDISIDKIENEVDNFCELLSQFSNYTIIFPTLILPPYFRGRGIEDYRYDYGFSNIIDKMNLQISKYFSNHKNFIMLNSNRWLYGSNIESFNPKLWYMGKILYGNEIFDLASEDIISSINTIEGKSKKMIIVDLDNTLWGGIVGDDGVENIKLGGHDHIGEAFKDFQKELKLLTKRGIILSIVSKNEEKTAINCIKNHPEMVLTIDDFVGWRINWKDKAENIKDLVEEINIGLDSIIFFDDNPYERERVKDSLPQILVPDISKDPTTYKKTLQSLNCIDSYLLSDEDRKRTNMYLTSKKRESSKSSFTDIESWLKSLDIKVIVEEFNKKNSLRISQLLNKTNQMNLRTRRLSLNELEKWVSSENNYMWSIRVVDKFEDSGITGIIGVKVIDNTLFVEDFILSCRVFSRNIENYMIWYIFEQAKKLGVDRVEACYIKTDKNKPCLDFFMKSGFEKEDNLFYQKSGYDYKKPQFISSR